MKKNKKLDAGYYEVKPSKFSKRATIYKPNTKDDDYYTYNERYYNKAGEESYEIHIHKPETLIGKIKWFFGIF